MRSVLFLGTFLGLMLLSFDSSAWTDKSTSRTLFVQAEHALQRGDKQTFYRLQQQLKDYPLYPYLIYYDLTYRVNDLPNNELQSFFKQYPDLPPSPKLYEKWLIALAKHQQWSLFIQLYKPSANNKLQCLYAEAKIIVGDYNTANTVIKRLWQSGDTQPKECDFAFDYWKKNGYLTSELIWSRFIAAFQNKNVSLAQYLMKSLSPDKKSAGKLMLSIYNSPIILTNDTFVKQISSFSNEVLAMGLVRLAQKYPISAKSAWENIYSPLAFNDQQKEKIIDAISNGLMRTNPTTAQSWFNQIDSRFIDDKMFAWQIRQLLANQEWKIIQHKIEQLPADKRTPIWQYWYARCLEEQNQKQQSQIFFSTLAKERNYYGFLAANRLQKPFPIQHKSLTVTQNEYSEVAKNNAIKRAYEFYQLKRNREGDIEWWSAITKMDNKQKYVAAKLASSYGWNRIALATTQKTQYRDDLALLYPTLFSTNVNKEAKQNQLNPALLYALIRQESLFQQTAVSHVGARGLMQLMPATAIEVARKLNYPFLYIENLFDPATNIHLGSAYLNYLLKNFKGHPTLAIASYNAGPNRVKKWLPAIESKPVDLWVETIPITETREYVKFVTTFAMIYEHQLGVRPNIIPYLEKIPAKQN